MTHARFELDDYTTRVLDVVKGKYGLKNRNEALKRFVKEYGENLIELKIDEKILREIDEEYEAHIQKYGNRSMNDEELDELLGITEEDKKNL